MSDSRLPNTCANWQPGGNGTFELACLRHSAECFALPYGGLGFASHVLTYYCLIINILGRRPLMPWKMQKNSHINLALGLAQLISTTITSVLATTRCAQHASEFIMLSIWLIMTSIASSLAGLLGRGRWIFIRSKEREENRSQDMVDEYQYQQRAELALDVTQPGRNLEKRAKYGQWLSWFLIGSCWFTGSILGLLAALNTLIITWHTVAAARNLTFGFVGCVVFAVIASSIVTRCWPGDRSTRWSQIMKFFLLLGIYALFYIDWLVAAVMDNWAGAPDKLDKSGRIIYWVYFACKRFVLFLN
jgi:hypothetical protein